MQHTSSQANSQQQQQVEAGELMLADVLTQLRRALPQLHGNRRRVAQYILDHAWEVRGLAINELAQRVGVAENSVSRFCHALGFSGYRDFSAALSLGLGRVLGAAYSLPTGLVEGVDGRDDWSILNHVFNIEIQCMRDTLAHLEPAHWRAAVDALSHAGRVLCLGMGATAPLAAMANYRLNCISIPTSWTDDPALMVVLVGGLGPGDVVIGLSYIGQTRGIVDHLRLARERQVTTIAITAVPGSMVTTVADVPLVIFGPDVALSHGQFAARVAGLALIDALVAATCSRKFAGIPPQVTWVNARAAALLYPVRHRREHRQPTADEYGGQGMSDAAAGDGHSGHDDERQGSPKAG